MKNVTTVALVIAAVLVVSAVLGVKIDKNNGSIALGGTSLGPESATTTNFSWSAAATGRQIKTGSGVLGSIIIGNATAVGTLTLYDATTTGSHADHPTTTLAVINTGTLSGTYQYNVAFNRGLVAEMSVTFATSTITSQ